MKVKLQLILLMLFIAIVTQAQTQFESGGINYEVTNASAKTVKVIKGSNCSGSITIPETVTNSGTTYKVIEIGEEAFFCCRALASIIIPNSVTTIGRAAFGRCCSLISVIIPNSVTTIGEWAFSDCTGLTTVTIPNSVTTIEEVAFLRCTSLTEIRNKIEEPSNVKLGKSVFYELPVNTCKLIVPKGTVNKYKAADQWKDFASIVETTPITK